MVRPIRLAYPVAEKKDVARLAMLWDMLEQHRPWWWCQYPKTLPDQQWQGHRFSAVPSKGNPHSSQSHIPSGNGMTYHQRQQRPALLTSFLTMQTPPKATKYSTVDCGRSSKEEEGDWQARSIISGPALSRWHCHWVLLCHCQISSHRPLKSLWLWVWLWGPL